MITEEDIEIGQLKELEIDNRSVLPMNNQLRLIVNSSDVIHDFDFPSFGTKVDSNPGRLNQVSKFIKEKEYFMVKFRTMWC